jgi:tetratricopeptide (TPR) repeat protein
MCYIKLEKWDKGIEACNEAITAGSEDVKAYFRRGKCYRHVGELDKARADFDVVLAKDPNDANVRKELAEIAKRQKVQVCVCVSVCVCVRERERERE